MSYQKHQKQLTVSHLNHKIQHQHSSEGQETSQTPLYYHSILCNPYLLENPASTEHSFMQDLFSNKLITKVRKSKDFLSVDLREKPKMSTVNVMEKYQFKDYQIQNELKNTYTSWGGILSQTGEQQKEITGQIEYASWISKAKDKSIIGWYLSQSENGIKLRSFSMSTPLLKMLDYKVDELALDIQHLGAQAIDVIDGQIYKASFLMILNTIRKFKEVCLKEDVTKEQIIKESQSFVINEIKGRGNKKLTVQTKIYMPSEFIVCFQVIRVLDQKQVRDNKRKINRDNAIKKVEQVAFSCLSKVARLPRVIDPSNSSKICTYIQIKNHKNNVRAEKQRQKQDDKKILQPN